MLSARVISRAAAVAATSRKLAWASVTRSPKPASRARDRSSASGSTSRPSRRTLAAPFPAEPPHDHPCPLSRRSPIPRAAAAARTRPRRRGQKREPLHSELRQPLEQRREPLAVRPLVFLEPGPVPDLEERATRTDERH